MSDALFAPQMHPRRQEIVVVSCLNERHFIQELVLKLLISYLENINMFLFV